MKTVVRTLDHRPEPFRFKIDLGGYARPEEVAKVEVYDPASGIVIRQADSDFPFETEFELAVMPPEEMVWDLAVLKPSAELELISFGRNEFQERIRHTAGYEAFLRLLLLADLDDEEGGLLLAQIARSAACQQWRRYFKAVQVPRQEQ